MESIYKLQQRADALRRKNLVESISPEEVGGLHADTLAYMADMEQNINMLILLPMIIITHISIVEIYQKHTSEDFLIV